MKTWQKVLSSLVLFIALSTVLLISGGIYLFNSFIDSLGTTTLIVENLDSNRTDTLHSFHAPLYVTFTPDSKYLLGSRQSSDSSFIVIHSLEQNKEDTLFSLPFPTTPIHWNYNASRIYYFRELNNIQWLWYFDTEKKEHICRAPNTPFSINDAQLSPTEHFLLFSEANEHGNDALFLIDLTSETQYDISEGNDLFTSFSVPTWADTFSIAFEQNGSIQIFDIRTNSISQTVKLPGISNISAIFNDPSENSILYVKGQRDETTFTSEIYRVNLSTSEFTLWRSAMPLLSLGFALSNDHNFMLYSTLIN